METRRFASIPVTGYRKDFCDYMGYELVGQQGDYFYYKVPAGHICRIYINSERWKEGKFNKEKFLRDLECD